MQDHVVSWTPDGTRLITFRVNLRSVRIFRYLGVESVRSSSAENLCEVRATRHCVSRHFKLKIRFDCHFQRMFALESEVVMMMGSSRLESASLRTDCTLFTDDGCFMVVATAAPVSHSLFSI